jgi:hypothetical protein
MDGARQQYSVGRLTYVGTSHPRRALRHYDTGARVYSGVAFTLYASNPTMYALRLLQSSAVEKRTMLWKMRRRSRQHAKDPVP